MARRICANAPASGDKWHLDEVVVTINGHKRWLWRCYNRDACLREEVRSCPDLCGLGLGQWCLDVRCHGHVTLAGAASTAFSRPGLNNQ